MMEIWLYLFQVYFKCKYLLICDNQLDNRKGIEYSYHQQIPISIEKKNLKKTQRFQDNNSLTLNRSIEEYYIWHGQNKLSLKTKLIRSGRKNGWNSQKWTGGGEGALNPFQTPAQLTWLADFFPTVEPGSRLIRSKGPTKGWARICTIDWDTQNQIKIALSY